MTGARAVINNDATSNAISISTREKPVCSKTFVFLRDGFMELSDGVLPENLATARSGN